MTLTMKYAIIAAGEGSRLAAEGITAPKPLVEVGGEPLIDRLVRIFMQNDADEIVVICNDSTPLVARHLLALQRDGLHGRPVPLRFVVKSTPSSMHSLHEISPYLQGGPFVLTTVDTIFRESEFQAYVEAFSHTRADGLMGVTNYVDDEKPLWVGTSLTREITGFYDAPMAPVGAVSAGIYGLQPQALSVLDRCVARGESRMRNFQRALIADGLHLLAWPFTKVFDIDHASDIAKAEESLEFGIRN